ncbi:MAG TPA: aldehyde dehydrogenase family protein [Geminicoccus sp.]|jgi:acyl-CoA reductase-like NAD-dependent aldehyde dehydrogenase|uniref:aldehyde dehydrogenase family protein n=1 Tax=Geminicoccus sp. TaxID=2024832 RepID=UPI002E32FD08|nr:aldehyde dehydrogenase family protein [Geminicoccus sp.]HEX2526533.1 aldehyde dehydrogenase family protein [Geminicoccus sp.]
MTIQRTITPVDQSVYVERELANGAAIQRALEQARSAQAGWRQIPLEERIAVIGRFVDAVITDKAEIGNEITWQMGRPISQSGGELGGFAERARYMMDVAGEALADVRFDDKPGFTRFIRKVPMGVIFVIAPWNYPYLTAVNSVVPALIAGNAVILKHSAQTPLVAERFAKGFQAAGLPDGVFQFLHTSHEDALGIIRSGAVAHVNFTGSVAGGHEIARAAGETFISTTLELGGKDPAYVRPDANLQHAIENLGDGAFFNSGQCCCGIERLYVHEQVYDAFIDGLASFAAGYRLGDPTKPETNIGPMAKARSADFVRDQVDEAVGKGARPLVDTNAFPMDERGSAYVAPQVLVGVDHGMRVMREESFGPVVGVMKVSSDEEAVALMNDSPYGLTAAIWTSDVAAAERIGDQIETGTVFMNRCDYLDPALAWTGVKDTGRGVSLSRFAYDQLTRLKSFHLREKV